ncbi:hypothetical protein ONS95_009570 [Cadophora gregata]|uniref:uncharacterized protein n=1 Tax=Cadophora gregata TaxID=51156 RepID=UPI0026DD2AB8|nr:uncharacterized protein ONS95_009570 [Cadophora gregata]KAK0124623.1 hypothetical protein ONS95_009570 [Cadophora gregata]KAK0129520.1 hypothetical protein ONS96_000086 [Cadophora gregata f. sp. sojae]
MAGARTIIGNVKKIASRKSSLSDPTGGDNATADSSTQTNGEDTTNTNNLPGQTDGADAGNEDFTIPEGSSEENTEPSSSAASSAHRHWSKSAYALPPSEEMAKRYDNSLKFHCKS